MDFRQLKSFVFTVETKNFSTAAEKLYLSQPTVSAHVHALEKELQVQLIKRTTKAFEITPDGQRFYEYALSMLQLHSKAVSEFSQTYKKTLHIGASSIPGKYILPKLLADYHAVWPDLHIHTYHSDSMDIIQKVSDGNFDVGFVGTAVDCDCKFIPFSLDELVIATPNTPYYRKLLESDITLSELLKEPFIMRSDDSGTKLETEHFLSSLNISTEQLHIVAHMNDAEALRNCIIQGLGISIISRRMAEHFESTGELLIFPQKENRIIRKLYFVFKQRQILPKTVTDFIGFIKTCAKNEL